MKILYTIADLQPESGGPSRSVCALAGAVTELGAEAEILALEYGSKAALPKPPVNAVKATWVPCRGNLGRNLKWSPGFFPKLVSRCRESRNCVLHDNGLWLPTNHAAARAARATGIPFLVSPRGMLAPWSLRFRRFKKRLAWVLYQRLDLNGLIGAFELYSLRHRLVGSPNHRTTGLRDYGTTRLRDHKTRGPRNMVL